MKNIPALACLAIILFSACGPTAKVTSEKEYKDTIGIKSVFVVVVTDAATRDCMNYYQNFFVDSLKSYGLNAAGTFYCCRDKKTDIKALMDSLAPAASGYQTILGIVMAKVVTGYGASSQRGLELQLFDFGKQEVTWKGKLRADFSWFISDENYRSVAHKMVNSTLDALKYQEIVTGSTGAAGAGRR